MIIDITTLTEHNLKKLKFYLMLKKENKLYDLILGGSLSLILQNIIPQRNINDIDLCYFKYFYIPFVKTKKYDSVIQCEIQKTNSMYYNYIEEKFDLFVDPRARYFKYQIKINNCTEWLNLQIPSEIIEAKMIYLNRGVFKHLNDILCYLNKLKEKNDLFELNKKNNKLNIDKPDDNENPDDEENDETNEIFQNENNQTNKHYRFSPGIIL